ncbi:MAG: hypothetical protein Q8K99_08805 [Actinomycetota bacterium]|nr:hypothetical protein [Actinomycetota bacterium]
MGRMAMSRASSRHHPYALLLLLGAAALLFGLGMVACGPKSPGPVEREAQQSVESSVPTLQETTAAPNVPATQPPHAAEPPPRPKPTAVSITAPTAGEDVDAQYGVSGVAPPGDGERHRLLVQAVTTGKYFPQGSDLVIDPETGDWLQSCYFGDVGRNVGESFIAIVARVSDGAANSLDAFQDECDRKNAWPGMTSLPSGVEIVCRVEVRRR